MAAPVGSPVPASRRNSIKEQFYEDSGEIEISANPSGLQLWPVIDWPVFSLDGFTKERKGYFFLLRLGV